MREGGHEGGREGGRGGERTGGCQTSRCTRCRPRRWWAGRRSCRPSSRSTPDRQAGVIAYSCQGAAGRCACAHHAAVAVDFVEATICGGQHNAGRRTRGHKPCFVFHWARDGSVWERHCQIAHGTGGACSSPCCLLVCLHGARARGGWEEGQARRRARGGWEEGQARRRQEGATRGKPLFLAPGRSRPRREARRDTQVKQAATHGPMARSPGLA